MTEPLTKPSTDLRGFAYMPLDVVRLRDSETAVLCSGEEFRAAVLLWCAAWHQVPAASLPKEDRLLANLAGYGRDMKGWMAVRDGALRGFVECSDGRLYHPVIAEKANEAWAKLWDRPDRAAERSEHARKAATARWGNRNGSAQAMPEHVAEHMPDAMPEHCPADALKGIEGKGGEKKEDSRRVAKATPPNPAFDEFWKAYPARKGENPKAPARKLFEAAVKQGVDPQTIIAGIRAAAARHRDKIGTEFIPQAETWLRQRRWEEYAEAAPQTNGHAPLPEIDWPAIVAAWIKTGVWSKHAPGNEPGAVGCRCPVEVLEQHGIDPKTGLPNFLKREVRCSA